MKAKTINKLVAIAQAKFPGTDFNIRIFRCSEEKIWEVSVSCQAMDFDFGYLDPILQEALAQVCEHLNNYIGGQAAEKE